MTITQVFYDRCQWLQSQRESWHQPRIKRWVVALSGGLDSVVTLQLAVQSLPKNTVHAVHVNHQLQSQSHEWQQFCQSLCDAHDIPLKSYAINPQGTSEKLLRDARYECFVDSLKADDCLLFGHHANDQAETMLFRMVRGAGSKGVSGIPIQRELGEGHLLRPLLSVPRAQLESYAQQLQLQWVEDPSNHTLDYDRNYLRHKVVKPLIEHWPQACEKMALSAALIEQEHQLLNDYLLKDLESLVGQHSLDLEKWKALAKTKREALLRLWLKHETARAVSIKQLAQINDQLINSKEDSKAHSILGDYTLRRYRHELFVFSTQRSVEDWPKIVCSAHQRKLQQGTLTVTSCNLGVEIKPDMYLRESTPGQIVKAVNRPAKKLKKLFQEQGVAPWYRDNWPLLMSGNQVVAVVGICVCEGWLEDTQNKSVFCLEWDPL